MADSLTIFWAKISLFRSWEHIPPIIMIDDSGDYSENLVQMSNDFDTPAYIPQTPKPQKSSLRTMGVSSGVGVAIGAAALGAYSILKNKDEKEEEEEDFGYDK